MQADLRWVRTEEEKAAVYRLRYELYVEGQGLFHDKADHGRRWLVDEHDADSRIAVAEVDGRVVGAARINWGGDAVFSAADRESFDMKRFNDVVDEHDLVSHYRKLGVRPFGELYNHPTNGLLVPIVLITVDFEHLAHVDSPMLGVLRQRTKPVQRLDEVLARLGDPRPSL